MRVLGAGDPDPAHMGVPFQSANVLEDDELREGIKAFSQWPTIPQLYVKGEFVGGCDIVSEMFQAGELETLMKEQRRPGEGVGVGTAADFVPR